MPALQVKDFPADVYDELRNCANNEDRSISQQTIHILRRYLELYKEASQSSSDPEHLIFRSPKDEADTAPVPTNDRFEKRRRALQRIAELPPVELPPGYDSVADLVRESREERAAYLDSIVRGDA